MKWGQPLVARDNQAVGLKFIGIEDHVGNRLAEMRMITESELRTIQLCKGWFGKL